MPTIRTRHSHPLVTRVARDLIETGQRLPSLRLLVAVSGGPDSVCLLAVLDELQKSGRFPGLTLHVAHMNYGLRGKESDEDEVFVRTLAAQLDVPISCERANVQQLRGASLQARARKLRYAFFDGLRQHHDLAAVATGHTADDQAETVLMWLLRGAGVRGLGAMPILRQGWILRPLLHVPRRIILDYLSTKGLSYRSDSSNENRHHQRNRIRHELLPLLQTFNPQIAGTLARSAEVFAEDALLLEDLEREEWPKVVGTSDDRHIAIVVEALQRCSPGLQRRLLRRAWVVLTGSDNGLNFRHVTDIIQKLAGARHTGNLDLPLRTRASRQDTLLVLERTSDSVRQPSWWTSGASLPLAGQVVLDEYRRIEVRPVAECDLQSKGQLARTVCTIDLDRAGSPLVVRSWRSGDWFCPRGMRGHRKKLQDFFTDEKVPREDRPFVPVVVGPSAIVWVAGYRGDERMRPRPDSVRMVTLILHRETAM